MDPQVLRRLASCQADQRIAGIEELISLCTQQTVDTLQAILSLFLEDDDAEVKRAILVGSQAQGLRLDMIRLLQLLDDEDDEVRLATLRHLDAIDPNQTVPGSRFPRLGQLLLVLAMELVNDPCPALRVEALRVLSTLPSRCELPPALLMQGLYKETTGPIDFGPALAETKTAEKAGKMAPLTKGARFAPLLSFEATPPRQATVPWSACGALIHGLEDGLEAVRLAAVQAIAAQATWSEHGAFASRAVLYLLDVLADDAMAVRCRALRAIRAIADRHQITLTAEHLTAPLHLLSEPHGPTRRAVLRLLAAIHLKADEGKTDEFACLSLLLPKLASLHDQYEAMRVTVMQAAWSIGRNHADLICNQIARLLRLRKFMLMPDGRVEEGDWMVRLMMVKGAGCPVDFLPPSALLQLRWLEYRYAEKEKVDLPHLVNRFVALLSSEVGLQTLYEQLRFMGDDPGLACLRLLVNVALGRLAGGEMPCLDLLKLLSPLDPRIMAWIQNADATLSHFELPRHCLRVESMSCERLRDGTYSLQADLAGWDFSHKLSVVAASTAGDSPLYCKPIEQIYPFDEDEGQLVRVTVRLPLASIPHAELRLQLALGPSIDGVISTLNEHLLLPCETQLTIVNKED